MHMKRFKSPKKHSLIKVFIFFILIVLAFSFTMRLLIRYDDLNINSPEKYVRYLLREGFNNQSGYKYDSILNIDNPISLIEENLDINTDYEISTKEETIKAIEKKNKQNIDPILYIYNSHDEEGYIGSINNDYNISPNVKLASYMLEEALEKLGIKSIVETRSIKELLNNHGWKYNRSYDASRIYIEDTLKKYPTIKYLIDLHRDSLDKDRTTINFNNNNYATILFIVGGENANYLVNQDKAYKLSNYLNGISKGVILKQGKGVNGVYNQDISTNMFLIEIGGQNNNMEEVAATVNELSLAIDKYIKEDLNEKK